MKTILLAIALLAVCLTLLAVRIIFGRHKEFLHGHACGGVSPARPGKNKNTTHTNR